MKDPLSEVRRGLNSFVSSVIEVPPDGSVDADLSTRASEIKDLLSYADDNVSDWHEIIDLIDSLHADSKKSDPPVTQEIRPEIVQDFIENILKSVCGSDLDLSKLKITEGRTTGGALTLSISHQAIHTRYTPDPVETPVNFQYEIVFSQTNRLLAPSAPRLNAPNMLVVPASEWNTDDLRAIQNAFRRSLVADPLLHPRFNSKTRALSEYQVEAVDSLYEALQRKGRALGVMATAAGKTVVAWNVLDRILTEAKAAGRANGKVIFCVNNTVILEEAQQKLEEWFPGKYSISHMYGGKKDFSGDIIFATPDTLASEGQVAEILQASPISALVIDEVHHLPAVTYRQVFQKIEEKSREESWGTKFLGLTATETRPDRMSVIEFFDREIDYQYRTGDGRREGFLARTNYDLIDRDINPKDDIPIDEGSELYRQYREARYLPSRYPYLLNMYEVGVAESLDKRGLILCPGVKKAEELCNYFNNYGRTYAVVLTSEERGKDPGLFAAKYEAWKTGRWPEKYKNDEHGVPRRVPEVVMAVDIFREGTDVPGISYINLWADTNSSIRFLQSIGRGMRLSPFKTHIVIHDSVGLTRKLHLLHHLALLYVPSAQQRDGERPEKDESLEIEVPDAELCIAFDESGTQFIERYLSDVPQQLELTYGSYGLIPNREMPRLDTYIMEQLGFEPTVAGTQAFREFLQQVADGLVNGADDGQIKAWREKILPAFYCIGLYDGEPDEEIPILGNTTIVFHRLLDRLQSLDHRVTDEGLFRLFPDFDPKHESRMRLVAKNLATLRRMVYGKSAREMMELCIEELLDSGKIQPGHELFDWLSLDRDQLERDDIIHSLVTQLAEGHRPPNTGELAGVSLRQHGRFGTVGAGRWQRICTALYLSLDRLEDRLVSTDFMNAPDAFRRLLIDRGLAIGDILTPAKFFNRMFSLFDTYLTASERAQKEPTEDNEQNIINAAKALDHFLTHQDYNAFLHFRELGKARITTLLDYAKRLDSTIERRGSLIGTEEHAIKTHFDEMLQTACIRQVFPLQGPEKLALEIQRVPYDRTWRYEVNLLWPAESERAKINGISPVIDIHEDALGQAACLIHSSGTPNILQIAYRAGHLSAETREDIVAQMARSFGLLEGAFGARLVVILPQDTGKRGFYHSLAGELLEKRDCDLISGLRSIRPDIVSTATLDFNLLEIRESRLAFLDPGNVSRLRVACGGPGAQSFDYRLAELYLAIAEFDQLVLPTWPQAFRKLETVRSGDPFIERVAQELSREMEILIRDDLSGRATRSDLLNIFRYLGGDSEAPLSESQIVVSALHLLARNKEGQDGGVNDFSAGIRSSIRQLTRVMMLSEMREDIAASGDELRNATSFCRQTLQKISRGNGWARSFEADAKMLLDNIQRGKVAVHTTRPSSSTLPLEIGPEPVGPSGAVGTNQNFLDGKVEITLSYRPKKTRPHAFSVKQTPSTGKPNMLHWDSHCGALLKEKADGYTQKGTTTYAEVAMLSGEWHLCRTCQPIHPGHDFMNWEGYAPRRKGVTS